MTEVMCSITISVSVSVRWKMDASSLLSPQPGIAGLGNVKATPLGYHISLAMKEVTLLM